MDDLNDELTAYHEAGHCVVAVLGGGRILRASIIPEEDGLYGLVEIEWETSNSRRQIESEILSILAGPVAEMIYRNEMLHPAMVPEWADDWKRAQSLARRLHADSIKRLRWLEQQFGLLYRKLRTDAHWSAIAAVSDLLLAHEELEHEQIEEEVSAWIER